MDPIKCIKFKYKLVDNLNIVYNVTNHVLGFWNKCQICIFNELNYENLNNGGQLINFTEFTTVHVILSGNYLICLDSGGNIYMSALKFKRSAPKRMKSGFQKRDESILCIDSKDDKLYSLKNQEKQLYFCIHKITSEFQLIKKVLIKYDSINVTPRSPRNKHIFYNFQLSEPEFIYIKEIFKTDDLWEDQSFVIFSFDNLILHAFLVSSKVSQNSLTPIKLFTSPSQINNINIVHENGLNILVSLAMGTVIKLPLNNNYQTPETVHLNVAIHKLVPVDDLVIYTDGMSMWKAENIFSEDIAFRQFTVKHVKDFIKIGDQIICTTYERLMYLLLFDEESNYLEPPTTSHYCPSEHIVSKIDYLNQIMNQVEKNNQLMKIIVKEEIYLTTLALCNRSDIVDEMITYKIIVFENYEDILKEGIPLKFADEMKEYFDLNAVYFLIKITTIPRLQQKFTETLSNMFGNLKIHITLISDEKVLKTSSIKIIEPLEKLNVVLALNSQINLTNVTVHIKLVTSIPSALNEKETLWVALQTKNIVMNPEHFIKTNVSPIDIQFLKEPTKSIEDLIYENACHHHGELFKINRTLTSNNPIKWSFYVKLPKNYEEALKNKMFFMRNFNTSKANYLLNEISSEEFLKSTSNLSFIISKERVEIEIVKDGMSDTILRVNSQNAEVGLGIRNFISNLVHNNYSSYNQEFVNNALYESVETLEKSMKQCIINEAPTEEFLHVFELYQRTIIGALLL